MTAVSQSGKRVHLVSQPAEAPRALTVCGDLNAVIQHKFEVKDPVITVDRTTSYLLILNDAARGSAGRLPREQHLAHLVIRDRPTLGTQVHRGRGAQIPAGRLGIERQLRGERFVGAPARQSRRISLTSTIVTSRYITPPGLSVGLGGDVMRAVRRAGRF